jgi:hypothetical protein
MLAPLLAFAFHQLQQVLLVAERLAFGLARLLFIAAADRRQMELLQVVIQIVLPVARLAH